LPGSLFAFGFLLGLRHALEADHVAAVAALATRSHSGWHRLMLAGAWGIGHSGALLAIGAVLVLGNFAMPAALTRFGEGAAGALIVLLGADVLRRLWQTRVHVHAHAHTDGTVHAHAHAHAGASHGADSHEHPHEWRLLSRAWLVGSLHGLGGSAAVVLLSLQSAGSPAQALGYVAIFGVGTILGMAALTLAIALPLRISALRGGTRSLELAVGVASVAIGVRMVAGALLSP
jgi:high-affinity nickel permease